MLKVLIDCGNAAPWTGTGVYAKGLLSALNQWAGDSLNAEDSGVSSIGKSLRPLHRLVYLLKLYRLRAAGYHHADIIHFANIYAPRKIQSVAYVVTIHDLDPVTHPHLHSGRYSLYFDRAVRHALERADLILTDTEAVQELIVDRYRAKPENVMAIGVGLNSTFMNAVDIQAPRVQSVEPTVLFVGRLLRKKNIAWVARAITKGIRTGAIPKVRFVIAGNPGDGVPEITSAIKDSGGNVEWMKNPDIQSLVTLYLKSSIVILPSFTEGFGIPLLEAMYCGKPVIASKIPTSLEVARD
ncbi:MAG: glycosyltransferase family 1 protein, partial [bacterium]